jgi:hypothetical protein
MRFSLDWLKDRLTTPTRPVANREQHRVYAVAAPQPAGRTMTGKYLRLHTYLKNRYANTVVLTFAEIEDLLGFALPGEASQDVTWWTSGAAATPTYTDAWTIANRTAMPNLTARVVVFETV